MNYIKVIQEAYSHNDFTDDVFNAFDFLKDNPSNEFFDLILKIATEKKNFEFIEESLRSLKYCEDILQDNKKRDAALDVLAHIIESLDFDSEIKKRAIVERGNVGEWPDLVLRKVIEDDSIRELKVFAFRAILTQLKLPYQVIDLETELAIDKKIEPDFYRINEITQARADGHFDHLITDAQQS